MKRIKPSDERVDVDEGEDEDDDEDDDDNEAGDVDEGVDEDGAVDDEEEEFGVDENRYCGSSGWVAFGNGSGGLKAVSAAQLEAETPKAEDDDDELEESVEDVEDD